MVTKENFRVSGVYGSRLLKNYAPYLCRQTENQWLYKTEGMTLAYYPKSRKFQISGKRKEELENTLLLHVNQYLQHLGEQVTEEGLKKAYQEALEEEKTLSSNFHILNMEVLSKFGKEGDFEGFFEALSFEKSYKMMLQEQYEEMLLLLLYLEEPTRKEYVDGLEQALDIKERTTILKKALQELSTRDQEELAHALQKIKI